MSSKSPPSPPAWELARLADLALAIAIASPIVTRIHHWPTSRGLEDFWDAVRQLRLGWQRQLTDSPSMSPALIAEVVVAELPIRVWSTVLLASRDAIHRDEISQIVLNAFEGLAPIRQAVYQQLLDPCYADDPQIRTLDTVRRRCERWIDLLAGPSALAGDVWNFVMDPRRARDFGEESLGDDNAPTAAAVEKLATAGLRMAFMGNLPGGGVCISDFEPLARAIQNELPPHLAVQIDRISPRGKLIAPPASADPRNSPERVVRPHDPPNP